VFVGVLVGLLVRSLRCYVLGQNISKTVADRGSVPTDHQWETACGESNGHVIDNVMRPLKVKVVTPIYVGPIISKTARDTDSVTMEQIGYTGIMHADTG